MNYTLNQLRVFLKITQEKSVTKAAEELHLTQPAVSIQLKNFQDQFEIPLTEVIGRKIYITEFGREIAEAAEAILDQVNAINYKTMAFKGQMTGKLKISVVSTGKYLMPYFLSPFIKQHPGIELVMDVTNKNRVIKSLDRNEVDFSLVSILPQTPKVEKLDLLDNILYLVGNKPHNVKRPMKANGEFKDLPFIFREEGSGTRQTMESFISKNKISVLKKLELTSNEAVKQAVLAGLGYSVMPLIGIKNELDNESLHIIPVEGLPITTTWSLIWLKEKKHSPAATSFLEFLEQEKEQIANGRWNWIENY